MNSFYVFIQNNSGGYVIENDDVGSNVIIESDKEETAIDKMRDVTRHHSISCSCCGPRWTAVADAEADSFGSALGKTHSGLTVVYFADGSKGTFELEKIS